MKAFNGYFRINLNDIKFPRSISDAPNYCNRGIFKARFPAEGLRALENFIYFRWDSLGVNSNAMTLTQCLDWLKMHPLNIIYAIADPIETPLSPSLIESYRKLHTNAPATTVFNDAGAGQKIRYTAEVDPIPGEVEAEVYEEVT